MPLKKQCKSAALVALSDDAGVAIDVLGRIHPPAHVIIVSSRHDIYPKINDCIKRLPEPEGLRDAGHTAQGLKTLLWPEDIYIHSESFC